LEYDSACDGAFRIKKVNTGILGEHYVPFNIELIKEAKKLGLAEIPMGYYPSVFSKELLENDFKKNLDCYPWFPDEEAWELTDQACDVIFSPYMSGVIRTFDEAISAMEKSTSPGYPYNKAYTSKGQMLAVSEEVEFLRECVDQVEATGEIDIVWTYKGKDYPIRHIYWQTSPKGEIRTVDKLLNPDRSKRKTRTFMCCDVLMYIIGYMLYGDQNDSFLRMSDEKEWSAVGMTPFYGGWDAMSRYLLGGENKNSCQFDCFDVSHMEASVNDNFFTRNYRTRNKNLHGPMTTGVKNLMSFAFKQVTYSYVIGPDGWLYLIIGKLPSGWINTLVDNTMSLIRVGVYNLARQSKTVVEVLTKYYTIRAKMVGDDSIFACSPLLEKFIDHSYELGFTVKRECDPGLLQDSAFLNAGFYYSNGMWFMRPNFDKMRASIFYLFKSKSWRLAYVKVCSYRMMCYAFKKYRDEADALLDYILKNHRVDMEREKSMDDKISYFSAISARMSDRDNEFLLTGKESIEYAPGLLESRTPGQLEVVFLSKIWSIVDYLGFSVTKSSL
jgi:hypothetical protein